MHVWVLGAACLLYICIMINQRFLRFHIIVQLSAALSLPSFMTWANVTCCPNFGLCAHCARLRAISLLAPAPPVLSQHC
jgi:hypothetical protein